MKQNSLEVLPHSDAIERRVIGAMMLDVDNFRAVIDSLREDDFYSPIRAKLFSLLKRQEKPDPYLVLESIRATFGDQHQAAWDEWQKCDCGWFADNLADHCARLRQLASSRRVAVACMRIAAEALEPIDNPADFLDRSEVAFGKAVSAREDLAGDELMSDGMVDTIRTIEAVKPLSGGSGRPMGIKELDSLVGGFQPGALYVIAGRPSMGKSAFATQIALECALDGYMQMTSLEMTPHSIRVRLLSAATGIDSRVIERNALSTSQWTSVQEAAAALSELHFGWTRGVRTIENLKRTARAALRRQKKVGGVLVDYMQLLRSEDRFASRELEIAYVSRELKLLAEELECPVLGVSQLNRDAEKRADNRPMLSDLRESGAIEQDADCVLLLYRDEYYNDKTQEPGTCEINVAKNRAGMTGTCKVRFERTCTRFRPLSSVHANAKNFGGS